MRLRRIASICATAAVLSSSGCWFKKTVVSVPTGAHNGGTIVPTGCDYTVTLRDGATAPIVGQVLLGPMPTPYYVHLGITGDASTSMVIQWRSDYQTLVSTVQYGVNGATDTTYEGFAFDYQSAEGDTIRLHEAHLCGLQPDTEYTYRVGGTDTVTEAWSPSFTFRTAPATTASDSQIVVLILGDTRDGYDVWKSTLDMAFSIEKPDLLMFSGDAVTLGPQQAEWETWWANFEPHSSGVPIISAHGNHDDNAINYFSQFMMPGDEENFGFDYGSIHFTVLNDSPLDPSVLGTTTEQFLDKDLSASVNRPWRFVMHHRPIWSAATGHGGDEMLRAQWQPLFDQYRPDVVFNGHDHDYERTFPMHNSQTQTSSADGTIFIVAGSSGAPLYDSSMGFWTDFSEKTNSFVILKVRQAQMVATAYRGDGSQLDTFTLTKSATP